MIDPELLREPDKYRSKGFLYQPWDRMWAVSPEVRFNPDEPRDQSGKWTDGGKPWAEEYQGLLPAAQQTAQEKFAAFMPHIAVREARANAKLDDEEKAVLANYQRNSNALNGYLRRGDPAGQTPEDLRDKRAADILQRVINEKGLPYDEPDRPLWRGVDGPSFFGRQSGFAKLVGKVIEDKGFLSTTTRYRSASKFGSLDLRLTVPQGRKYIELSGESEGTEYLLNRDSKIRIDEYYPKGDGGSRGQVYATVLP